MVNLTHEEALNLISNDLKEKFARKNELNRRETCEHLISSVKQKKIKEN